MEGPGGGEAQGVADPKKKLVFEKNANFFAENCQKSQKNVIITSTPRLGFCLSTAFFTCWDHWKLNRFALAAWRSGHRIRLRNRRPGFESRQGIRFLWENITMVLFTIGLKLSVCQLKKNNGSVQKNILKRKLNRFNTSLCFALYKYSTYYHQYQSSINVWLHTYTLQYWKLTPSFKHLSLAINENRKIILMDTDIKKLEPIQLSRATTPML
jgi:hypothetical protein